MKLKYILIHITIIVLITNCSNNETKNSFNLNSNKKIEIPIDNSTPNISKSIFYFEDIKNKIEYLCYLNENKNEINFYNLGTQKLSHKVKYEKEGIDGVTSIGGFYIISLDSILIVNRSQDFLYITNNSGKLIKKVVIGLNKENNYITNGKTQVRISRSYSHIYNPLVVKNNKIYASTFIPYLPKNKEIENLSLCLEIDYLNNEQTLLKAKYPLIKVGNEGGIAHTMNTRTYDGKKFVYSFFLSHDIMVTDDHKKIKKYEAKSKYLRSNLRGVSVGSQNMKDFVESPHYDAIIYDKYRNVYYRFVYPGKTINTEDNIIELSMYCEDFSVMILNKDFEVLGEKLLPPNTYYMNMAFVSKEGLCISTQHPKNPNYKENYLSFQLFNLSEN